jgi:hypothetical protein
MKNLLEFNLYILQTEPEDKSVRDFCYNIMLQCTTL